MARQIQVDDSAQLDALAADFDEESISVQILVNNAGVSSQVQLDDLAGLDDDVIDSIFRINWRGSFAMVRAFRRLMPPGAVVVNVSSVAGSIGLGSNVAYCASKAGIDSMTRSLARALAPDIRVVSVAPGFVCGDYTDRLDQALVEAQRAATPLARLATPADVASAVYAAAFELTFTTGAVIPVDGGRPLGN